MNYVSLTTQRVNATDVYFSGDRIRIRARLRFTGDDGAEIESIPIRDLVLNELNRQFSHQNPFLMNMTANTYDFPHKKGRRIKVACKLELVTHPPYVHYHVFSMRGISCYLQFPLWRRQFTKRRILLFTGDIRTKKDYSALQLSKVASHEFGHALGIGDLYPGLAPYGLCYRPAAAITKEMPANDIMRTHFKEHDFFTPNDLEMAWIAHRDNAPQTHTPTGFWYRGLNKVSEAVRLQNV